MVALGVTAAPADARGGLVVYNTGEDIFHIRDLTSDEQLGLAHEGIFATKLGYKYSLVGLFWLDLWRSDGEVVVYSSILYTPLSPELRERLGDPSTPWRYHLPPGLLLIAGAIEFFVMYRSRRKIRTVLVVGGVLVVVALVFYLKGLDWEFLIPLGLGLHHLLSGYLALRTPPPEDYAELDTGEDAPRPRRAPVGAEPLLPPPPNVETDPFRAPPQKPPIAVVRPRTAPAPVPVVADPNADKPKLLN